MKASFEIEDINSDEIVSGKNLNIDFLKLIFYCSQMITILE